MKNEMPFLRPRVVPHEAYASYLETMDASHQYSNNGPLCREFEARLVRDLFRASDSAVTVSNATTGLMLAIRAVRKEGARYAVMPSFTFAATPLAAQWAGLTPYFIDIDPDTWALCPAAVAHAVELLGDDVAVVVPYATFGANIELDLYKNLHSSGIPVVVDAAASLGSQVGESNFGAGAPFPVVFSMHATKSFPIGEGGVIVSSDSSVIDKIRRGANFGFGPDRMSEWSGFNAKLPEILGAVALATLDTFHERVSARSHLEATYLEEFGRYDVPSWKAQAVRGSVSRQFFAILAPHESSRAEALQRLSEQGIEARTYFSPACHEQPSFSQCPTTDLTVTSSVSSRILSLPLWEGMPERDIRRCVGAIL